MIGNEVLLSIGVNVLLVSVFGTLSGDLLFEAVQDVDERSFDAADNQSVDNDDGPDCIAEAVAILKSNLLINLVADVVHEASQVLGGGAEDDDSEQKEDSRSTVRPKERVTSPLCLALAQSNTEDNDEDARDHNTVDVKELNGDVQIEALNEGNHSDATGEWAAETTLVVVWI